MEIKIKTQCVFLIPLGQQQINRKMTPNVGMFLKQLDIIFAGENAKVYGLLGKQFGSPL